MPNKIQFKRGLKASLPDLDAGEPGYCTDTQELFIGNSAGSNMQVARSAETVTGIINIKKAFGAVGDGVTNDTTAFSQAESATVETVYLEEGTYIVNGITLSKKYIGSGKIKLDGVLEASNYTNITDLPATGNYAQLFSGDQRLTRPEQFIIQDLPERNTGTDSRYYNWELIPHLMQFNNYSGSSGYNTTVDQDSALGQKILYVRDTTPFTVGQTVLVGEFTASNEVCVIASIQAGVSLTMVNNLTKSHFAANRDSVALGGRTMHSAYHTNVDHHGLGDAYGQVYRVIVYTEPEPEQYHYFQTATGGMFGGDMYATSDGVYLTGYEYQISDTTDLAGSKDIASVGIIGTFTRNNDTGARGVKWFGTYHDSVGTKYMESAHLVRGKFKSALDTVNLIGDADKAAIRMAENQRIYFDCTSTPDVGGYSLYGNVIGQMWMGFDTTGLKIANGANAIRLTSLDAVFSGNVKPSASLYMLRNNKVYLDSGATDTYIFFDGTNVKIIKSGVQVATW